MSTGSGSIAAIGYLEACTRTGITTAGGCKARCKGLKIAMKRDSATGDGVRSVAITKKGFKEYAKDDIEKLLK